MSRVSTWLDRLFRKLAGVSPPPPPPEKPPEPALRPSAFPDSSRVMKAREARGYRNKNPFNINRVAGRPWNGENGIEPQPGGTGKPRFATFVTHEHGIRAGILNFVAYQEKHGIHTIRAAINRHAPPSDNNNTASFIDAVCRHMNVHPDQVLDFRRRETARKLAEAVIAHELGANPYPASAFDVALDMAGLKDG